MMFLAVSQNIGDPSPFLAAEAARVADLIKSGVLTRLLLKTDHTGAVLLMEAPDEATAQAALRTLPLVKAGIATFQLTSVFDPLQEGNQNDPAGTDTPATTD